MTPEAAWSAVVAGEDAAIYAYSVAGARTAHPERARSALAAHRIHRDRAAALAEAAGGSLPVPAPAYSVGPVSTQAEAQQVLAHVENALTPVYADRKSTRLNSSHRT